MKSIFTVLLFILVIPSCLFAQGKGILSGRVLDSDQLPVSYATVQLEGAGIGTNSGEQGEFLLKADAGKYVLVVNYIGADLIKQDVFIQNDSITMVTIVLNETGIVLQNAVISGAKVKTASATRTMMEVQDIPQAIVVVGQKTIKQQGAFDLTTLTRNISGLNFTGNYSGAGSYQFYNARGFDLVNSQNYRWNGMMIWNLGNNYADNIEQVEFLKGPTSILFGDAAPGGVLNFSTKKPLSTFYTAIDLKIGQWGLVRPSLDLSGPLNKSKTLRYRLNTSYQREKSFRDFVESEKILVAPTIAWDINNKLNWNVEAVIRNSTATDDPGLVSTDGTVAGLNTLKPELFLSEPSREYLYADQSYFSTLTYRINDFWRLKQVFFYGNTHNRPWGIWPDQPDETGAIQRNEYGYYQGLQNLSATLDAFGIFYTGGIKHNLLFGLEYQQSRFRYTNEGYLDSLDQNNIFNMVYNAVPTTQPAEDPYLPFTSVIDRGGIYLQDQLMFFKEKLHLMVGLRAGLTRQGNDYKEDMLEGTGYEGYEDDLVTVNALTPRVGLVYKPVEYVSLYASYSEGYEVNSPDIFAQNYAEFATPPATNSTQFEIGCKTNLLANRLGVSLSWFQITKVDPYGFVYLDPINPNFDEYNVYYDGKHRSKGVELDVDGKLTGWLSLTAGAAYTHTEIVEDPGYPAGNMLPNAPRYTGNLWLNAEPTGTLKGLSFGAGYFYKSSFFSGIDNNPDLKIPNSFTLDVSAGYTYKNYRVQVNVTNLTNEVNYLNPWVFNLFDVQPLRRVVFTLGYTFK